MIKLSRKLKCYKIVASYPESKYDEKTDSVIDVKTYRTPFCNINIPDDVIAGKKAFVAEGVPELRGDTGNLQVGGGFIHSYANIEDALKDLIYYFYCMSSAVSERKYELWECKITSGTCFKGQFECEPTSVYASCSVRFVKCLADNESDARKMEKELLEKEQ